MHTPLHRDRPSPSRRHLFARVAGWLVLAAGGLAWPLRRERVAIVERDGWFLDARDR